MKVENIKKVVTIWECRNCGYLYKGEKIPEICPLCSNLKIHFMVRKKVA